MRFLQNTITSNGSEESAHKEYNRLVTYRMKIKDARRVVHDIMVCYEPPPFSLYNRVGSFEHFKRIIIDSQSYALNKEGALKISEWLFGNLGDDLKLALKGHQLEITNKSECSVLDDEEWSTNFFASLYPEIHSSIVAYMEKLIDSDTKILELCGGDGTLAHKILSHTTPKSYILLDRNINLLDIARSKLEKHLQSGKMQIISCDLSTSLLNDVIANDLDIIMGCGALTRAVVSEETAKSVLEQGYRLLKSGGHLILSGLEFSWIDSQMLKEAGFSVLNSFCSQTNRQLYVAKKL